MEINARVTNMFSRFVYHITGVAVMVMVIQWFLGTPSSAGSKMHTDTRTNYSTLSITNYRCDMQTIDVE